MLKETNVLVYGGNGRDVCMCVRGGGGWRERKRVCVCVRKKNDGQDKRGMLCGAEDSKRE